MSRTPLLDELGVDALRLIAFSADRLSLGEGDILFRQGDEADSGFVVVSGAITLTRRGGSTHLAGPGALIGELALLCDTRRPATAEAAERSEVYRIARSLFGRLLTEYPAVTAKLRARLAARMTQNAADLRAIESTLRGR
ncbi:cyclic nucleotide-binding domain-containing protein [Methylopila sp. Yamaguchi]|uniref:cyclic nucleotide-binding domain-containing protein n=1 Tax=Methylopila sp. Yamaguchi TaxID=1437817 RepID=UPI000CA9A3B2|nr:cyclic nucleotide-binding domain-containing protein [Methylopila sp. Yamaguchi]GBD47708.1 cyclic nucleotide-binding protein [Methylopila sp. Yamaguchi]